MSRAMVSYGFEPGVAQRLDPERRFYKELSPTLRADAGDNQAAVATVYGLDTYNQAILPDICQSLRANEGGDTKPKVLIAYESTCDP